MRNLLHSLMLASRPRLWRSRPRPWRSLPVSWAGKPAPSLPVTAIGKRTAAALIFEYWVVLPITSNFR